MLLCSMACCARAMRDELPKSTVKRIPGPSTRIHVWKRPPAPNASPEPTNLTVTDIAASVAASDSQRSVPWKCDWPPVSFSALDGLEMPLVQLERRSFSCVGYERNHENDFQNHFLPLEGSDHGEVFELVQEWLTGEDEPVH